MIENELKYVLLMEDPVAFETQLKSTWKKTGHIRQGYVDSIRVRETTHIDEIEYHFAYKRRTNSGRNIEIETLIDVSDFQYLWKDSSVKLCKTRYEMKLDEDHWFIDLFKDGFGQTYFVLAECEMPEHKEHPTTLPEIVSDYMFFAVPREDERFAAKKLADEEYSHILLETVRSELYFGERNIADKLDIFRKVKDRDIAASAF